ncbi:TniQ family protein [Spirosoma arcticum]
MLPGSCYPQPDELLSSWVSRLALNHGMAPLVFWQRLSPSAKPKHPSGYYVHFDMDRYQLPEMLNLLAARTATPLERIHDTTLWDYAMFVKEKPRNSRRTFLYNWWLSFSNPFGTVVGPSFCASCLRKDGAHPYFRKPWRFSYTVACLDCEVLLANGCPICRSSIDYRQLNAKLSTQASLTNLAPNLATCRSCGYDLAQTPVQLAAPVVLALQQRLHRIWRESPTASCRQAKLSFLWLESIISTLVDFNGFLLQDRAPACFLVRGSRSEPSLNMFDDLSVDLRARLLYQAMVFLGEGWDEFSQLYAQYAHRYRPMYFYEESPMLGFLTFLLKSMPPDWMAKWSAFAPDVRDS